MIDLGQLKRPFPFSVLVAKLRFHAVGDAYAQFRLGRIGGDMLLQKPLAPGGRFTWIAPVGSEIAWGHGLENCSDVDIVLDEMVFYYDGWAYQWRDGVSTPLLLEAPPLPGMLTVMQA
jgi:hypothetical protein